MATALKGERVERAANLRGTSVTDFILEAVEPAATEAIREKAKKGPLFPA